MPIIQVHLLEGRSQETKARLVKNITKAVCESLGTAEEQVRIILSEMLEENFAVGGVTVTEKKARNSSTS